MNARIGWLVVASLVGIGVASCLVSTRSDQFECSEQSQCDHFTDGRICENGFCIKAECPGDCDSCDVIAKTCTINCTQPNGCNTVRCPDEFHCTITCSAQNNACDDIDCSSAASCDVTCSGNNACKDITCGSGPCNVTCSGTNGCQAIDCSNSCACDVSCGTSCSGFSCPTSTTTSMPCTDDGTTGTECSTSFVPGCSSC